MRATVWHIVPIKLEIAIQKHYFVFCISTSPCPNRLLWTRLAANTQDALIKINNFEATCTKCQNALWNLTFFHVIAHENVWCPCRKHGFWFQKQNALNQIDIFSLFTYRSVHNQWMPLHNHVFHNFNITCVCRCRRPCIAMLSLSHQSRIVETWYPLSMCQVPQLPFLRN